MSSENNIIDISSIGPRFNLGLFKSLDASGLAYGTSPVRKKGKELKELCEAKTVEMTMKMYELKSKLVEYVQGAGSPPMGDYSSAGQDYDGYDIPSKGYSMAPNSEDEGRMDKDSDEYKSYQSKAAAMSAYGDCRREMLKCAKALIGLKKYSKALKDNQTYTIQMSLLMELITDNK
jgi:hypothetical protein